MRRYDRLDAGLKIFLSTMSGRAAFVSVMTIMEIEIGIRQKERFDRVQAVMLRTWYDRWRSTFPSDHILAISEQIAKRCAELHVPDPRTPNDALIAATALEHNMAVVTRNVSDFETIEGCRIINPWST